MGDIEKVLVKTYEGTKESALEVLQALNVKDDFYHFNVTTGDLIIHKMGLRLRKGDCYHSSLPPEKFEAIG